MKKIYNNAVFGFEKKGGRCLPHSFIFLFRFSLAMIQRSPSSITIAVLLAAFILPATSHLSAEPISGVDSLSLPTPSDAQQKTPADALSLFNVGDYDGSLRLWKEVVKKNPDMPPAQVIMAQLFYRARMTHEVRFALKRAIEETPSDPEPYLLMADIALQEKDLAEAESLLEKTNGLLAAFDKSAKRKKMLQRQLQSSLAMLAEARNDWAGAQKIHEEILQQDPKNLKALQRTAFCLFQQKDEQGALEKLREAAGINPSVLTPEASLALFYEKSDDLENVKKWMKAAKIAAPKDLKTRLALGQCALEMGLMIDAQNHAIAALQINPKSINAEFFRGLVALCQKDYRTAESFFESVLNRSGENSFAIRNNLALALIEQQDEKKSARALKYAEANAKQRPDSANFLSTYAWVLYRLGRLDDAEKALQAAAKLGSLSIDTAYYKARILVDRNRKDEARQVLETALKNTGRAMFRSDAEELLEELKQ